MGRALVALSSGVLFGIGLAVSGMMNPARVRGFLDIFGAWDPTLAFVMGGALLVMALAWAVQRGMPKPVACKEFYLPGTQLIDVKLVAGAAIFGIGWGLGGLCPGPAIASLGVYPDRVAVFVVAMALGMALYRAIRK